MNLGLERCAPESCAQNAKGELTKRPEGGATRKYAFILRKGSRGGSAAIEHPRV